MPSTLVFPDGMRLAREDEIPGPAADRAKVWARVASANIARGYLLYPAPDERFTHYAEVNVDAPQLWAVFHDLCQALLGPEATLLAANAGCDPVPVGSGDASSILAALEPHRYQLAHDGFLQYGLVSDRGNEIDEVLVVPEKHLRVWMTGDSRFRQVMGLHHIEEAGHLEFLDQYPRVAVALPTSAVAFRRPDDLIGHLKEEVAAIARHGDGPSTGSA